jgi:hypothetical protein
VILFAVGVMAACGSPDTSGSGPTQVQSRRVDVFTRVEVGNGISLHISVGAAETVEVSAQENILPLIKTTVEAGTLRIISTDSFSTTAEVTVVTSLPTLDGITMSDGSRVTIMGLDSDRLDILMGGGASLEATGRVTDVVLEATGGATPSLATLRVETMSIKLSGGVKAALSVSNQLSGTASGGAVATVSGAATVDVHTTGGASVSRN